MTEHTQHVDKTPAPNYSSTGLLPLNIMSYSRWHTLGLLLLGEEVFALLDVGFDGVTSWFPAGWAD